MQLTASNVRLVAIVLTALCAVSGGIYLVFCKRKDYRTQRNEIQRFDLRCQEEAILAIFQTDGGTEK